MTGEGSYGVSRTLDTGSSRNVGENSLKRKNSNQSETTAEVCNCYVSFSELHSLSERKRADNENKNRRPFCVSKAAK